MNEQEKTKALIKKVRKLEIKTRGLSNQLFSGEYHSAFKGRGMTFSEVREYQPGDDVRSIDWNVTARFNRPFIKVFEEEREMTVMLLIDLSASQDFGSTALGFKNDLIAEIAAVLSFSAITNNDKVGAIMFTDTVEQFIPPKKGRSHILRIVRDLIQWEPASKGTDLNVALQYLSSVIKKRSTCFLLSDFQSKDFSQSLKVANRKHDIIGLHLIDPLERNLPSWGLLPLKDPETGKVGWVSTGSKKWQKAHENHFQQMQMQVQQVLKSAGVDYCPIEPQSNYVKPLMKLFKQRESK